MADVVKRVQYFDHQFLQVADFTDEQDYHRRMLALHNANMHTPGVAQGLDVTFATGATKVTVAPGMAIDSNGQEIVLTAAYDLELASFAPGATVYVVISYDQQSSDPATDGSGGDTRWTEAPKIEGETSAPTDGQHLLLSTVTRNGIAITDASPTGRLIAGAAGGDLAVTSLAVRVANAVPANWPTFRAPSASVAELNSALTVDGALTGSAGATITGALSVHGAATVDGALTGSGGATITGALNVHGAATLDGVLTAPAATLSGVLTAHGGVAFGTNNAMLRPDQGGSLELGGNSNTSGGGTPYIDFHYQGLTQDFNARIINDSNGVLTIDAATTHIGGSLLVTGGAITPAVGNVATAGIEFPVNPGGGGGDEAYIRYYVDSGAPGATAETTRLVVGIANDADDRLGLVQFGAERLTISAGNVGINETNPQHTLQVTSGNEVHSGGTGAGFSFANRSYNGGALGDVGNYAGSRWVWYAATGSNFVAPGGQTITSPGQARLWTSGDVLTVGSEGNIGVRGYDPHNGLPPGWGGGVHTWDLYAEGTVGAGQNGALLAYMVSNGTMVAKVKPFLIEHPLDQERDLIHAAVEGPEHGVYYRGEARLEDGRTTIELPRYFEALCRVEGRTVQLTPRVEDEQRRPGILGATTIRDGAFTVLAGAETAPDQAFYWEVKAVRADVDELEVEPLHGASPLLAPAGAPPTIQDRGTH